MTPELALAARAGLPDPLRVLIKEFPRDAWQDHPQYSQLIAFWLDRHLMFRRLLTHLNDDLEAILDARSDTDTYKRGLARYGGMLINQLHGHHQIEDTQYFPVMAQLDTPVARGFDLLDSDHHAMDGLLAGLTDAANGVLKADAAGLRDALGGLHGVLDGFGTMLNRHLVDEEELVVPVLLKYAPAQFR
ncbi:Hemerythrin HHE cation binding domain-containing protein [Yoonia tamlensis]|uniref:Hemerythrin HHE cation binding domain-containing protein n=1 Tax=Yoonia tamlensis TaxID=390270 RepID=A0A1I6HLB5_9RHOB|nr:hemerythrin domain-containing protein [Yoonia tamlensis]SFR55242.1 Hemerythrin HHE cation binding domain-containing protein [Yoonia tamlensis]